MNKLELKIKKLEKLIKIKNEALKYCAGQSNWRDQLVGIESDSYFAWINERANHVLKISLRNIKL